MSDLFVLLGSLAVKSTALLLVAASVHAAMRRASAAARHLLWTAVLAAIIVLPAGPLLAPRLAIDAPAGALRTAVTAITVTPSGALPWREAVAVIWLIGALLLLARMIASSIAASRLRARAWKVASIDGIPVLSSDEVASPAAFGVLRPCILTPPGIGSWDAERRRIVLLHEAAHVKRGDLWAHLAANVARVLYWYNPLVWLAASRLEDERERACDDLVLAAGEDACSYAGHLIEVARSMQPLPSAPGIPIAATSRLEARLRAILDRRVHRSGLTRGAAAAALVAAIAASTPVALLRADLSPGQIRVGGNRQAANLITKVSPRYPASAKDRRVEGKVVLEVVVRKDGHVGGVRVISSPDASLSAAAVEGVAQWVYRPTLLNGKPIEVVSTVDVNFTLVK